MMAMAGVGIALGLETVSSEAFKATGRTEMLPRMYALTAVVPIIFMVILLPFGATGMGIALSLGMTIAAGYGIWALSRIARLPLRIILAQVQAPFVAGMTMAVGVSFFEGYVVHARHAHGLAGVSLLMLDLFAVVAFYLGSLAVISRQSIVELKELGKLLFERGDHPTSTSG